MTTKPADAGICSDTQYNYKEWVVTGQKVDGRGDRRSLGRKEESEKMCFERLKKLLMR